MPLSNYAQTKLLDHITGHAAYTMPAAVYAAAFTASPGGTGANESAMARQLATYSAGASGSNPATSDPAGDITFTNSTGASITVTHVGLFDASTAGNFLMYGTLSPSKTVPAAAELIIKNTDFDTTMQ